MMEGWNQWCVTAQCSGVVQTDNSQITTTPKSSLLSSNTQNVLLREPHGKRWELLNLRVNAKADRSICIYAIENLGVGGKLFWGIQVTLISSRTFVEDKHFYLNEFLSSWWPGTEPLENNQITPSIVHTFQVFHLFIHLGLAPCKKIIPTAHRWRERL